MSEQPATTKRCQWCAEEVQAQAIRCKHCGGDLAPKAVNYGPLIKGLFGLALIVIPLWFGQRACDETEAKNRAAEKTPAKAAEDEQTMAWVMAKDFVTRGLKSPGTANFGEVFKGTYQSPTDHVRSLGAGRYEAHGWVDSQNGFGALLRTNFRVTMQRDGGGTWTATDGPTFDN